MKTIVARWQDWTGKSFEHLVLKEGPDQIVAEAAVLGTVDDHVFAARYKILCDVHWRVRKIEISEIGSDHTTELVSDGVGNWVGGSAMAQPHLANAIDADISISLSLIHCRFGGWTCGMVSRRKSSWFISNCQISPLQPIGSVILA